MFFYQMNTQYFSSTEATSKIQCLLFMSKMKIDPTLKSLLFVAFFHKNCHCSFNSNAQAIASET